MKSDDERIERCIEGAVAYLLEKRKYDSDSARKKDRPQVKATIKKAYEKLKAIEVETRQLATDLELGNLDHFHMIDAHVREAREHVLQGLVSLHNAAALASNPGATRALKEQRSAVRLAHACCEAEPRSVQKDITRRILNRLLGPDDEQADDSTIENWLEEETKK